MTKRRATLVLALLLPAALSGCGIPKGPNGNPGPPDLSGPGPGPGMPDLSDPGPGMPDLSGGGGPDAGTNPGELTLSNCTTSIDASAPAFYKNYFQCVTITMSGTSVVISTQDLPPHRTYYYGATSPNYAPFDTRGGQYHPNPATIKAAPGKMTIPPSPVSRGLTITPTLVDGMANTSPYEYSLGPVGTGLDSVHLYNDLAAPGMTLSVEEYTFDSYNGHPQMAGDYHYHTSTQGPLEVLAYKGLVTSTTPGSAEIEVYGIMCDGTVILGCTELDGSAPSTGNLDAQNGHVHDIKDKTGQLMFSGRYHTHVCPGKIGTHKYTPEIQYYTTCQRN